MSQYPPPPPSYGAYDQPPPPGFGYPPGNQGPYYPQPGYPQPPFQPGTNPATCPPGPGGYYPGQPATQTIEKGHTSDSSDKEKEKLLQEINPFSAAVEDCNYLAVTTEYDNENSKQPFLVEDGERHKYIGSEMCDEKSKSASSDCGDVGQKNNASEAEGKQYGLSTPEYCSISQRTICSDVDVSESLTAKCDDVTQKPIAVEANAEKYEPIPLKWIDVNQERYFAAIHGYKCKRLTGDGVYVGAEETTLELNQDEHKQNAPGEKCRPLTSEEDYKEFKPTAPELDHEELEKTLERESEEFKPIPLEDDFEKVKPSAPEMDGDKHNLTSSKKENPKDTKNIENYKAASYPTGNYQRWKDNPLGSSNEMNNLAVMGPKDFTNHQPRSASGYNYGSSNFTSSNFPVIITQPAPYNRFGESDRTDCCNDDCCAGDCGGDDCCKDDCCAGDCGGDDCCKDDCCAGDECCKDGCNDDCCKDDCCTDDQAIQGCVECCCICIFAICESCEDKS